ncbi:MAG: hypothetical protein EHM66_00335 [Deltaproteobacteria bacterium]|nr:MAG: hypothetical protein EHM66_00335 [Deltaproteobacteria bacterium]
MMTMNPAADAGLEGGNIALQVVSMIMEKQAMDAARAEAKALDYRNFDYQKGRDKVSDRFSQEALNLSKEKLKEDKMLSRYGLNKDKIGQIENMFNTNVSLQDRALKLWSR